MFLRLLELTMHKIYFLQFLPSFHNHENNTIYITGKIFYRLFKYQSERGISL